VARPDPELEFGPGQSPTPDEKTDFVARGLALEADGFSARAAAAQIGVGYQSYLRWTGHFRTEKPEPAPKPAPTVRVRMDLAGFVVANREAILRELLKGLDQEAAQDVMALLDTRQLGD
jgi:hypothetical protein